MIRKPYHARRMITAIRLPWELLVDLELEAQRLGVTRSQLVVEFVARGLGAKIPPPVSARHAPRSRRRRTRYLPVELRETSAPWLREPACMVGEGHVDATDNPRRPAVRAPVMPQSLEADPPPGG
jgi:hypothetical protein